MQLVKLVTVSHADNAAVAHGESRLVDDRRHKQFTQVVKGLYPLCRTRQQAALCPRERRTHAG